jgi:peptidyl-prolyl cis-trans isomerase C
MDPALEKVAFDLEKGRISEVIDTEEGYQVIRVLEKSDKRQIGFEEAKTRMGLGLFRKRKGELVHQYYQEAKVDTDPAGAGVLARVGDEALTEADLAPILAKAPEKEKEKLKRRWIRYFVETKVFSREARKVGLENEPDVADELSRRTDEVLANTFRKRFILDKFPVTDGEVSDYYQSHVEDFRTPLRIRVKTIVVGTREEAEDILQALKEGGAFGTLAKERSIDASASRYGELGWFGKGEKDPTLEKAALSLEKDQISDIIKTEAGYEIIKLMDKTGGEVRPLEKVEQGIKMTLQAKKMEQEKARYYKEAGVKVVQ